MEYQRSLIKQLADKVIEISANRVSEIERYCWVVVHEYRHGAKPSEYDIREIDEDLYINVLRKAREQMKPK